MSSEIYFRPYHASDQPACLSIFDANCPDYFAPNERLDYQQFLQPVPQGYEVCEQGDHIVGAFGVLEDELGALHLNWILLDPNTQGAGIGTHIMQRVLALTHASGKALIHIAASHKSAPFFARFGATTVQQIDHGWGPDMHRVDMTLRASGTKIG